MLVNERELKPGITCWVVASNAIPFSKLFSENFRSFDRSSFDVNWITLSRVHISMCKNCVSACKLVKEQLCS